MMILDRCPGSLDLGYDAYSPKVIKKLFDGKKVSPILPFPSLSTANSKVLNAFHQSQRYISISGYQEKYSMLLDGGALRLANEGEQGMYILKPIPNDLKNKEYAPANEHLTMQIAQQIFKIETAENGLVFFKDGVPAYLTKRFDVKKDKSKLAVEDFASLMKKTPYTHGEHYKYSGSYLDLFLVMKKYLPAWQMEAVKLFSLLIFNYLFSNGDAHIKNFSIIETEQGDFKLSPTYDLMNTRIHIDDADFALEEGLLPKSISKGNILQQFILLGKEVGITEKLIYKQINKMLSHQNEVENMIFRSFLSDKLKRNYLQSYQTKRKNLFKNLPKLI